MEDAGPYRDSLGDARRRLDKERERLLTQAQRLGRQRDWLPREMRRRLARLEREMARPLKSLSDVRRVENAQQRYQDALEVAIPFADHVTRERRSKRRERKWQISFALLFVTPFACGVGQEILEERPWEITWLCFETCDRDGRCTPNRAHLWSDDAPKCIMGSHDDCTSLCRSRGACEVREGRCVVTREVDCRKSASCRYHGRCTLVQGNCVARSDEDCAASDLCRSEGKCGLVEQECLAHSREDCERATGCKGHASCDFNPKTSLCRFTDRGYCEDTAECYKHGRCSEASAGICVARSDADCERGTDCDYYGDCSEKGGTCTVSSDADCKKSRYCSKHGRCFAHEGRCVAAPPSTLASVSNPQSQ